MKTTIGFVFKDPSATFLLFSGYLMYLSVPFIKMKIAKVRQKGKAVSKIAQDAS